MAAEIRMNKRLLTSWLLIVCLTTGLLAQQPQSQTPAPAPSPQTPQPAPSAQTPPPTVPKLRDTSDQEVVRITTNLVQVDVVVTKDGKQVTDLKPEDFQIFEDDRQQMITSFSYVLNTNRVDQTTSSGSLRSTEAEAPGPVKPITPRQVGRTMAIVIDDLGLSFDSMSRVRLQLARFINEKLDPTDVVAIIRTGGDVGALQQFTTDRQVLQNAVSTLRWNPCSRMGATVISPERSLITVMPPERQLNPRINPDRSPSSAGVKLPSAAGDYDLCREAASVYYTMRALRFILQGMSDLPGRKSMMIISDNLPTEQQQMAPSSFGFKRPVRENANLIDVWTQSVNHADGLNRLAEVAIRSSVVIYAIASQGLQTTGPHATDEISYPPTIARRLPDQDAIGRLVRTRTVELLRNTDAEDMLAKQTGGFMLRNSNEFGFDKVLEDQGGYYLIGYRPAATTFDRRFHHIKAKIKRSGVTVRTRAGFYGVSEADASVRPSTLRDRIDRALISPFGASAINVRATPLFVNDPVRGSLLRLFLSFDAKDLTFSEEPDGSHVANLVLTTILFGDNGGIAGKHDHKTTLRLRGRPFERAKREGVIYSFELPVKQPGSFQFRIAVVDTASSRVGSAGQFLSIPDLQNGRLALSGILLNGEAQSSTMSADDLLISSTLRRFRQGSSLAFGYTIYNAAADPKRLPSLTSQTIIFRDGKKVYTADPASIDMKNQADLKRIAAGARLQFGSALTPGEYVLQIVVEDHTAKRRATQWIQFDVVK